MVYSPEELPRTFGHLVKRLRLDEDWTQEHLGGLVGVEPRTIYNIESNRNRPNDANAKLIAVAFRLTDNRRWSFVAASRTPFGQTVPAEYVRTVLVLEQDYSSQSFPSALITSPFVGRQGDLDALTATLSRSEDAWVVVSGPEGIGKSSLLHQCALLAEKDGWRVLSGRCDQVGGQAPYAPIVAALASFAGTKDSLSRRRDIENCSWLVRLLPQLATRGLARLPDSLPPLDERIAGLHEDLTRYLDNIAGESGTLLILDDVQWASDDALALIGAAVAANRRAGKLSLQRLIVLSACETGAKSFERKEPTLDLILNRGDVIHHILALLPDTDMNDLLSNLVTSDTGDDGVSSHVRASITERAAGMPLYLTCWAGARASGIRRLPTRGNSSDDIRSFVRQQVDVLSDATNAILRQAAILSRCC